MAARKGIHDVDDLALRMMLETVTALRMFVNDEVNELQFAISAVAENMLRPGKQTIFCSSFGSPCTMYRVGLFICRKVLQIMFWEVPPAEWPIL